MTDVTRVLSSIEDGDPTAADRLLPLVYDELRRLAARQLAHEKPGQTLDATALVHEAYLRLVAGGDGSAPKDCPWQGRRHFFGAAAEAMRRILINRARDKGRIKRGGGRRRVDFDRIDVAAEDQTESLLALHEALESLAREDRVCADLVKLRFFAGMSLKEAADTLGMAHRSADRCWAFARAWLYDRLREAGGPGEGER